MSNVASSNLTVCVFGLQYFKDGLLYVGGYYSDQTARLERGHTSYSYRGYLTCEPINSMSIEYGSSNHNKKHRMFGLDVDCITCQTCASRTTHSVDYSTTHCYVWEASIDREHGRRWTTES